MDMTLQEAVAVLGQSEAARVGKLNRTTVIYWCAKGAPAWRSADVRKIVRAAEKKQNAPKVAA